MKTFVIVLSVIALCAILSGPTSAQPSQEPEPGPKITFKGGPGDTPETAVVINGAPNSMAGISAEYRYLRQTFGRQNIDWNLRRQSVVQKGGKVYDSMELDLKDGGRKTVFFDISEFFGKF